MKDPRQYEHYVIYGLLILLIILVAWVIRSQSHSSRYQVHYFSAGLVYVFDPATGHLWSRHHPDSRVDVDYVTDLGTVQKPCVKKTESLRGKPRLIDLATEKK